MNMKQMTFTKPEHAEIYRLYQEVIFSMKQNRIIKSIALYKLMVRGMEELASTKENLLFMGFMREISKHCLSLNIKCGHLDLPVHLRSFFLKVRLTSPLEKDLLFYGWEHLQEITLSSCMHVDSIKVETLTDLKIFRLVDYAGCDIHLFNCADLEEVYLHDVAAVIVLGRNLVKKAHFTHMTAKTFLNRMLDQIPWVEELTVEVPEEQQLDLSMLPMLKKLRIEGEESVQLTGISNNVKVSYHGYAFP